MITEEAKGHTWAEESKTPATCTQTGKINQKCSVCDATQTVNDPDAPALGHTWTEVDRTPATCAVNGKINQKCSVCNVTRSIDDPDVTALGHEYVDGYCTRCLNADSTPVKPNGDGTVESPYEISNVGELYWFAGLVNGTLTDGTAKNTSANAKLTADITVNRNVLKADGSVADETGDFVAWKPIGYNPSSSRDDNKAYKGSFDGQGHTISGLFYKASDYFAGLFGYCLYSNISNVCLSDSYIEGRSSIAGICGFLEAGYITNCKNSATVKGGEWTGGICGAEACNTNNYNQGKECVIANCYNDGLVISEYLTSGSIIGLLDRAHAYNCYNNSDACSLKAGYINSSSSADKFLNKTAEEIATGKVAYLLSQGYKVDEKVYDGSIWGQKIGTQASPVLNGDRVYDNSVYSGCIGAPGEPLEIKYENVEGTPTYADHNYVFTKTVEPTCISTGGDIYTCTICNTTEKRNEINMVDHEVVTTYNEDKTIEHHLCKYHSFYIEETENLPESEHNYQSNTDAYYELSYPGADTISITFDDQFNTETSCDYLKVYDKNGNQIAKYQGTASAGKTYTFDCDYIKLYFHSDFSHEYYGFKITKVVAEKAGCDYSEPDTPHTHSYGDYVSDGNATCTENGTETAKCACGETTNRTEENSALGHDWADATCTTPKTCERCDATEGTALGHDWADATCTTPKTCERCDATEGSALGHDWADATCTAPKTCNRCDATEGSALGHDWADATCTTPKTCEICDATEGSALGHDWADATCTDPKTCNRCEETEGVALGHIFTDYVSNNDATCTSNCTETATCDRADCDDTDTREIADSALGHSFTNYVSNNNATCTTNATETAICDREGCNETDTREIADSALGHSYVPTVVPANCTTQGYTTYTCSVCGDSYNADFTDALGHSFGTNNQACSVCGAANPNYVNPTPTPTPTPTPQPSAPADTTTPSDTATPAVTTPAPVADTVTLDGEKITADEDGEYVSKKTKKPSIKKLKKGKKAFTVTYSKVSKVSGYQVQYSTSKKFTKKTSKKITYKGNKKFTKTVSKLKGGKKYYVRVRTYKTVNGKKVYSGWSKVKTVTTKK